MADNMVLFGTIKDFIKNKCQYKKNNPFHINCHKNNSSQDNLPLLYDDKNYIQCFIKPKEDLKSNENDIKLLVNDSSFELLFYKNDNDLKTIKCLIILIVNDYSVVDKEEVKAFNEEKIIDINNEEDLVDKIKLFLYKYINENKNSEISLDKILLGDSINNIRFFCCKDNKNFEEEIKKIKLCESNIQIKNFFNINNILDMLNYKFKEDLVDKYLDEMPEELANLTKKYKNINFNNEMYLNYLNHKNEDKEENKEKNEDKPKKERKKRETKKKEISSNIKKDRKVDDEEFKNAENLLNKKTTRKNKKKDKKDDEKKVDEENK
jgi:hypothetical protein